MHMGRYNRAKRALDVGGMAGAKTSASQTTCGARPQPKAQQRFIETLPRPMTGGEPRLMLWQATLAAVRRDRLNETIAKLAAEGRGCS